MPEGTLYDAIRVELLARLLSAHEMRMIADPAGTKLPSELWKQRAMRACEILDIDYDGWVAFYNGMPYEELGDA